MNEPKRPINVHKAYHAHVYFDASTVEFATQLCNEAGAKFGLRVGRVHQKLVGPHTRWSCQLVFSQQSFDDVVPWLDEHRNGLSILIHGVTGDDYKDHTDHAYWLGDEADLYLGNFL
ncbi:4,5-dioxygenase [Marinomonas piezotolerans]|uniref:4,5-dioxygenase n=1 Tax=Marinomonas piezotolerans TaxID=2213058 RepID=A0A370UBJ7_9GAMM|nr:DOPA 4,5-dioxygenase family protein [Marinomonas piezotolerans]RDL45170.1 4,5-dioxygenase [Marinomonas piezotolerans]